MTTQSPVKRHCESCAGWGDCPCGDKNCRWERKNLTTIPTSIRKEIENVLDYFEAKFGTLGSSDNIPNEVKAACIKELEFQIIAFLLNSLEGKIEKLMSAKVAKELGDSLELFYGERECKICGTNPEKQREMILSLLQEIKEEKGR